MTNKSIVAPNIVWCVILCNYYSNTELLELNSHNQQKDNIHPENQPTI